VRPGGKLTYKLTTKNVNTADAMTGVKVEDTLPSEVTVDKENIKVWFGSDASQAVSIADSSRVTLTQDGQKLTFVVDKLAAQEVVHFDVPVTVNATNKDSDFENTSTVTEINGQDIEVSSPPVPNEVVPEKVAAKVVKNWNAGNEELPDSVKVQLYRSAADAQKEKVGDPVTLTAAEGWTYTWENLPKFLPDNQSPYTYSVEEAESGDYLVKADASHSGDTFTTTLTNTKSTDIPVVKKWVGEKGSSVTVHLMRQVKGEDGDWTEVASATLDGEKDDVEVGSWKAVFSDEPLYSEAGAAYDYEIIEDRISGYTSNVTGNADQGFTVTNTKQDESNPAPDQETSDNANDDANQNGHSDASGHSGQPNQIWLIPQMGDSTFWLLILLIAIAAGAALVIAWHHKKNSDGGDGKAE
jgi:uncharacterized repeat protein (TIGR01451 family)